jgi:polyisoprenoid-binding protein YceI
MSPVATPEVQSSTWNIDPAHSAVEFKVKHMMISNVKGRFTSVTGTLNLNEADVTKSRVEASADAATITTSNDDRDAHLRSADFFNVEQFPTLTFNSTAIARKADGELTVTGDLTIHGVTHSVTFDVEGPTEPAKDPWGNTRVGVSAITKISRKSFGLAWNAVLETGGILVGDDVTITLDVQFIKA